MKTFLVFLIAVISFAAMALTYQYTEYKTCTYTVNGKQFTTITKKEQECPATLETPI